MVGVSAGVVTAGVVAAGVVTSGVVAAGVVAAGVVAAGVVASGVVAAGVVAAGVVAAGVVGTAGMKKEHRIFDAILFDMLFTIPIFLIITPQLFICYFNMQQHFIFPTFVCSCKSFFACSETSVF